MNGLWSAEEEDDEFKALDTVEKKNAQRQARGFLILCISESVRERVTAEVRQRSCGMTAFAVLSED